MSLSPRRRRAGFTLVELLVVIAIIGVLSALLTVGLYAAFGAGKDFVLASELSQVELALENFKTKYGTYPPDLTDFSNPALTNGELDAFNAFIAKAYPRADRSVIYAFRQYLFSQNIQLDQAEALMFFLTMTSADARHPFGTGNAAAFTLPPPNARVNFLQDIPPSALRDLDNDGFPEFVQTNAKGAPIVYFDARTYTGPLASVTQVQFNSPHYVSTTGTVAPYASGASGTGYSFFNPTSFQLLSAGQDGEFGVDLSGGLVYPILNPTAALLAPPRVPESDGDNLANFTSKKKFDSYLAQ